MTEVEDQLTHRNDKSAIYSTIVEFVVRSLMEYPQIYSTVTSVLRGKDTMQHFVDRYIHSKDGDKVLDIGCGTGYILDYLPKVEYYGFDLNQSYIDLARKQYGNRGKFFQRAVGSSTTFEERDFDIVLAIGVLHHLNDNEARHLFKLASDLLKPGGRLITAYDGCYVKDQSRVIRFILWLDRGKFIRRKEAYVNLAKHAFTDVAAHIHDDLLDIPYTSIVLECTKDKGGP